MRQLNIPAIPQQTAATVTGAPILGINLFACSVQVVASAGGGGTAQLQVSNDDNNSPTNWSNISGAAVTVTGAGAFLIPKLDISYQWLRVVYTNTGTGTISANLKALGA